MAYTKKTTDIDLIVAPMPLTIEDRQAISSIIAHYKTTGEKLKSVKQTAKKRLAVSKKSVSRRLLTV
jgi:hypothetical protein